MKTKINIWITTLILLFPIVMIAQEDTKPIRVACVGNSITEGAGWKDKAYPPQLGALLGSKYDVRNFGLGGRTLLMKGDFPYRNEKIFEQAKEFDPQIVIIKLGTNDSKPWNWKFKDEFFNDYVELVKEFRKNDKNPQIFVCFPPPVFKDGFGITNSIIHDKIMPLIDSVKRTCKTLLIDFNSPMADDSTLFPDGIHPNGEGYGIMAKIAFEAITTNPLGAIQSPKCDSPSDDIGCAEHKSCRSTKSETGEVGNLISR
jgi:lysophospholipase L1-like esterase